MLYFPSRWALMLLALCCPIAAGIQGDAAAATRKQMVDIPPISPSPEEATFGSRINRTMTLLATSTEEHRNTVNMMFYGQSVTAGLMTGDMLAELQDRFPHANIILKKRAIGGFGSPALLRTAPHDLYYEHPDFIFFHCWGGEKTGEMEELVANMRKLTSADIMMFTHAWAFVADDEEKAASRAASDQASSDEIRRIAEKYGCELVEVRKEWKHYLDTNGMTINMLMGDTVTSNVHPNAKGHTLLAKLILRHFRYDPSRPVDWVERVKRYDAKEAFGQTNGPLSLTGAWDSESEGVVTRSSESRLKLMFHGNRVDVIAAPSANPGTASILIDGKTPSSFPEMYYCTRPSKVYGGTRPAIKRVDIGENSVIETWTLTITEIRDEDAKDFSFDLKGSVTGPDGSGNSKEPFVSNSGRIRIDPKDFMVAWAQGYRKKKCPEGFEITWDVKPNFLDVWKPQPIEDRTLEDIYRLAVGLSNAPHTLEIIPNGDGDIAISAIQVFAPPLR